MNSTPNPLSDRLADALQLACQLHNGQRRRISGAPYVAHLLHAAGIVLDAGGTEDEAIAALLHDAVEDQGGSETRARIEAQFGPTVARIVDECSDTDQMPKPPWRGRKEAFLARLADSSTSAQLVTAADKLDNVSGLIDGYHALGEQLWDHFHGGRDGTLWYYRAIVDVLRHAGKCPLIEPLDRAVTQLEQLTAQTEP